MRRLSLLSLGCAMLLRDPSELCMQSHNRYLGRNQATRVQVLASPERSWRSVFPFIRVEFMYPSMVSRGPLDHLSTRVTHLQMSIRNRFQYLLVLDFDIGPLLFYPSFHALRPYFC